MNKIIKANTNNNSLIFDQLNEHKYLISTKCLDTDSSSIYVETISNLIIIGGSSDMITELYNHILPETVYYVGEDGALHSKRHYKDIVLRE